MAAEQRRSPRVTERLPLRLDEAGGEWVTTTENLSASGAYCTLDRFVAPMTKVRVTLEVPHGTNRRTIVCSGVVVRIEPVVTTTVQGRYHVAVFFTDVSERDRAIIANFVRERLQRSAATNH
jgi:hypothetical protein